jgi:hypothetical protein
MNNPFKSNIVKKLIIGIVFSITVVVILTMMEIYVNPRIIVGDPVTPTSPAIGSVVKQPVPVFQLNTNFNTNILELKR